MCWAAAGWSRLGYRVAVVKMEHAEVAAASACAQHQVQRRVLSDAVVNQVAVVLEWLCAVEQPLLCGRDVFVHVDLGLDACNEVAWFNLEDDYPAGECRDEYLHGVWRGPGVALAFGPCSGRCWWSPVRDGRTIDDTWGENSGRFASFAHSKRRHISTVGPERS